MTVREAFEDWWKLPKPAEVDFYRAEFEDCFKAGRESMREKAMDACLRIYHDEYPDAEDFETGYEYLAIKELP